VSATFFRAPKLNPKKPKYATTTNIIPPIMAIFRNLCANQPTINPMMKGRTIMTIVGNPPMLPEVMNRIISSKTANLYNSN
jgi:hypothetical protein